MDTPLFDLLFDTCRDHGYELSIREQDGLHFLVISAPGVGPLVMWTTFQGSIEETARYALLAFRTRGGES